MDIQQAINEPDKKSLVSLEFTAEKSFPSEPTAKGFKTRVLARMPQGMPKVYITIFSDQPTAIRDGVAYSLKSQNTGQGLRGVQTNHYNGKPGFTAYNQATIEEQGAAPQYVPPGGNPPYNPQAPVTQPVVQTPQPEPIQYTAPQEQMAPTGQQSNKMNEDELIAKCAQVYAKGVQKVFPVLQGNGDPDPHTKAHQFGLAMIEAVPLWWFGEKTI